MGEVYELAALALAFAGAGWLATVKLFPSKRPKLNQGGTWRLKQETVVVLGRTMIRVLLVREYEGRETGRLVVRQIDSAVANWDEAYLGAVTEAEHRLAALQSAEQR